MAPFDILMIDDEQGNYEMLRNEFANREVVLRYASTLEEGMNQLSTNNRIMAVILDGKGIIRHTSGPQVPKEAFVHQALVNIKEYEKTKGIYYPKCILTAWYGELKNALDGRDLKIFEKNKLAIDNDYKTEFFNFLISQVKDTDKYILRQKYSHELELLHKYELLSQEELFLSIIQTYENGTAIGDFNRCRQFIELIIGQLYRLNKDLAPENLFHWYGGDRVINHEWLLRYWEGKPINNNNGIVMHKASERRVPKYIIYIYRFIKDTCSLFSHVYSDTQPPRRAYDAVVNALLVLLDWCVYERKQLSVTLV